MGAKKKGGKGKKKGGKGKDIFNKIERHEENEMLAAQQEALHVRFVNESEEANRVKASENEKRLRFMQLERQVKQEQKLQMEIIADMTRQFKSVEEDMLEKINDLSTKKSQNENEIEKLEERKTNLQNDIKIMEQEKKEEISTLSSRIEQLSSNFATMLKDTLEKMKQKIEDANKKWEQENDEGMLRKFDEYTQGSPTKN